MKGKEVTINGIVTRGKGEGYRFSSLDWFKRDVHSKCGFDPYPGTLNLKVKEKEDISSVKLLQGTTDCMVVVPPENSHYCPASLFKAVVEGYNECCIVIPKVPEYEEDKLEILAPLNLRDKLGVRDGAILKVQVILP